MMMAARGSLLLVFSSLVQNGVFGQNTTDNLQYVDQLIGSANGGLYAREGVFRLANFLGNVFPGATLPYGMVSGTDGSGNRD